MDIITLLSTGRNVYANYGIIGINAKLEIFEGYDGEFSRQEFTKDEKAELADRMIALWQAYKDKVNNEDGEQ